MRPVEPPEIVLVDRLEPCPYLAGQTARMPLRLPLRALTPHELDQRLDAGDRRYGRVLYRPVCPACRACEAIRIDVAGFAPSRSQRRIRVRAREVAVELGEPQVDSARLELYHRHRQGRGLGEGPALESEEYARFLVDRCCESIEIRYSVDDQLVGIAIADRGERALNAVYCYYDPRWSGLSLGTFSILTEIDLCRAWGLPYLYLGFYIADNNHMSYKAGFHPHERRIDGRWQRFEAATKTPNAPTAREAPTARTAPTPEGANRS